MIRKTFQEAMLNNESDSTATPSHNSSQRASSHTEDIELEYIGCSQKNNVMVEEYRTIFTPTYVITTNIIHVVLTTLLAISYFSKNDEFRDSYFIISILLAAWYFAYAGIQYYSGIKIYRKMFIYGFFVHCGLLIMNLSVFLISYAY